MRISKMTNAVNWRNAVGELILIKFVNNSGPTVNVGPVSLSGNGTDTGVSLSDFDFDTGIGARAASQACVAFDF